MVNKLNKIEIDCQKCISCALCTTIAPKTFIIGKDGKAVLKNQSKDTAKKINEAVTSCPVGAISK